ncbi:protein scylla [Drosophila albomicans]|uniref:Protein scylla n=1 Tax=Drosophila albomicans TaxID=7291 RepID=A0A6P8Y0W3_DROAB|nr:protein scylla [Drosophila albomicans]
MKMEVLAMQSNYGGVLGSNKSRDWTSTLTPPTSAKVAKKVAAVAASSSQNSIKQHSASKKTKSNNSQQQHTQQQQQQRQQQQRRHDEDEDEEEMTLRSDVDAAAVNALSLGLLDKLREAKARHLTCTEVSLPCDLTPSIAAEIIRVSEKEPCGIRGCTIYIEFEDEPQNSRRIASLKVDPEMVSTFEVYLTLRQDHRGWTALLPQFMKSLARTITISPEYTITKHKLYSPDGLGARRSYSFGSSSSSSSSSSHSQAIATPTI